MVVLLHALEPGHEINVTFITMEAVSPDSMAEGYPSLQK